MVICFGCGCVWCQGSLLLSGGGGSGDCDCDGGGGSSGGCDEL